MKSVGIDQERRRMWWESSRDQRRLVLLRKLDSGRGLEWAGIDGYSARSGAWRTGMLATGHA